MNSQITQLGNLIKGTFTNNKINLLLFRHAQTTSNIGNQLCGWTDSRLNIRGREQANSLLPALFDNKSYFNSIYSSDLKRAQETAEISLGFPETNQIQLTKSLREIHFGDHEGLAYDVLEQNVKDIVFTLQYQAPKGESWGNVKERAEQFIRDNIKRKGTYLAFSHGGLICTLTYQFGIVNSISNCSCVCFEVDEQNFNLNNIQFTWEYPNIQEQEI